jgi:hypothetical protein
VLSLLWLAYSPLTGHHRGWVVLVGTYFASFVLADVTTTNILGVDAQRVRLSLANGTSLRVLNREMNREYRRTMSNADDKRIPEPAGRFLGMPYDWRPPTISRIRARWWNPDDARLLTPKSLGWGYDINLYRLFHRR